jgi:hypothetical protein
MVASYRGGLNGVPGRLNGKKDEDAADIALADPPWTPEPRSLLVGCLATYLWNGDGLEPGFHLLHHEFCACLLLFQLCF